MKEVHFTDRKFKFWFYQISHSEAIIRSTQYDSDETVGDNIDIYLGDIDYIEMPSSLHGLQIKSPTEDDVLYLKERIGKLVATERIIVFVSEGRKYYVVASVMKILEHHLAYGELPISISLTSDKK